MTPRLHQLCQSSTLYRERFYRQRDESRESPEPAPALRESVDGVDECDHRGKKLKESRCGCVFECLQPDRVGQGLTTCTVEVCKRCERYE